MQKNPVISKKQRVTFFMFVCLIPFLLAASKFNINGYVGFHTCNLPKGSKTHYGIPVRTNNEFEVSDFEFNKSKAIILIKSDKSHKCSNNERIGSFGEILAAEQINPVINGNTNVNLECRWKDQHNADHLVGVVKERLYGDPYVSPKQAWLVNCKEFKFVQVNPVLVECFDGRYDDDESCK